ncbi:MAG: thioredoxin domain-containing protein [Vicinamibacterales bacterium]
MTTYVNARPTPRLAALLFAALVSLTCPSSASAQFALTIQQAEPDVAAGTITVAGAGFGARPFVTLDLVPLNVQLAMDQRIIAVAPLGMMPPGAYLLTVSRGPQGGDTASIEVRLGPPPPSPPAGGTAAASPGTTSTSPTPTLPTATDAAARVGDRTITLADVDREWQRTDPAGHLSVSRQLYEARRKALTEMVNTELLSREASARGLSVEALLKEELPKRTIALPDNAVTSLYQSLGDRTRGASIDQLRPALREWLARKVEPDLAKMTYLEELTKVATRVETLLDAPRVTVEHHADDPSLGAEGAAVEMVIFGDFQSPAYARYVATLPRVREMFGARLRVVYKHFPANDPASIAAAEAAACANLQGKFWPFHDTLLGAAGALDTARFKKVGADIGVDRTKFDACVDREETRDRIGQALEETGRYDLPGTPSILVNGRLAPEPPAFLPPFEFFKRLVEEELALQARAAR